MNEIVVIAEHDGKKVKQASYETISFAVQVAKDAKQVAVLVIGDSVEPIAREIAKNTKLNVVGIESLSAKFYNSEAYTLLLEKYFNDNKPNFIFISHTPTGWDYAPQLALALKASYIPAVISFSFSFNGKTIFTRQVLNGKLLADFVPPVGKTAVITVMPGATKNISPSNSPSMAENVRIMKMEIPPTKTKTIGYVESKRAGEELGQADIIIAIGRGIGSSDNIAKARELASLIPRCALASSRPLCDTGWMPIETQVGMTGRTVAPKVYIALGISGAVQHTMGMQNSDTIIAVNTDKNALFFQKAHYCIIADINEFIPVLIKKLREKQ